MEAGQSGVEMTPVVWLVAEVRLPDLDGATLPYLNMEEISVQGETRKQSHVKSMSSVQVSSAVHVF